jgi:hypothetical protein
MVLPVEISRLLEKHEGNKARIGADEHSCEGAKFHSPRPLRIHPYILPDKRLTYLCGTCRDNLGVYLFLWDAEGSLDWPTQRFFGNQIRAIANPILTTKRVSSD